MLGGAILVCVRWKEVGSLPHETFRPTRSYKSCRAGASTLYQPQPRSRHHARERVLLNKGVNVHGSSSHIQTDQIYQNRTSWKPSIPAARV